MNSGAAWLGHIHAAWASRPIYWLEGAGPPRNKRQGAMVAMRA